MENVLTHTTVTNQAVTIARERPVWWHFVSLAALAGLPAVAGV